MFEETVNGSTQELITYFSAKTIKGEIVIVVGGASERKGKSED